MNINFKSFFTLTILSLIFISCSDNEGDEQDTNTKLYKEVLTDVSTDVITETYHALYQNSSTLLTAIQNLTIGDDSELQDVKNAWIATREPWELSEGFLYGPVDTEGIDPAIDSWPVDVNAINGILNSGNAINSSTLETNNEARGFHTIEYFIWGLNGDKPASALTTRELEYLVAVAQNLKSKTEQLYKGWWSSHGNFVSNFINAGETSSIYSSQKNALSELVEGLVIIADEVANGKIEEPLNGNNGGAKPEAEESRFSNNSKADFADNIRSIKNVYLGDFNGMDNKGLTDIVSVKNSTLDNQIKSKIDETILAIEAIPGTFTNAIQNNRSAVQNAQNKVSELHALLNNQLMPLINNL